MPIKSSDLGRQIMAGFEVSPEDQNKWSLLNAAAQLLHSPDRSLGKKLPVVLDASAARCRDAFRDAPSRQLGVRLTRVAERMQSEDVFK